MYVFGGVGLYRICICVVLYCIWTLEGLGGVVSRCERGGLIEPHSAKSAPLVRLCKNTLNIVEIQKSSTMCFQKQNDTNTVKMAFREEYPEHLVARLVISMFTIGAQV